MFDQLFNTGHKTNQLLGEARHGFRNFTNPPYWGNRTIWDLDSENPANNGLQNEALIVWIRVAAFPDFWKLYAKVVHSRRWKQFSGQLPRGQYYLKINYSRSLSLILHLIKIDSTLIFLTTRLPSFNVQRA